MKDSHFPSEETFPYFFPDWYTARRATKEQIEEMKRMCKEQGLDWVKFKVTKDSRTWEEYIKAEEDLYKSVGLPNKKSKLRGETNEVH